MAEIDSKVKKKNASHKNVKMNLEKIDSGQINKAAGKRISDPIRSVYEATSPFGNLMGSQSSDPLAKQSRLTMVSEGTNLKFSTGLLSQEAIKKLLDKHKNGEKLSNDLKLIKQESSQSLAHFNAAWLSTGGKGFPDSIMQPSMLSFENDSVINPNKPKQYSFADQKYGFSTQSFSDIVPQMNAEQELMMGELLAPELRPKYDMEDLVSLISQHEQIQAKIEKKQNKIQALRRDESGEQHMQTLALEKQIKNLRMQQSRVFSITKLRQTIICGIPTEYVNFKFKEKIGMKHKSDKSDQLEQIEELPEEIIDNDSVVKNIDSHQNVKQSAETNRMSFQENYGEPDVVDIKQFNTRGKLWKIICKIDEMKSEMLENFNSMKNHDKVIVKSSIVVNREQSQMLQNGSSQISHASSQYVDVPQFGKSPTVDVIIQDVGSDIKSDDELHMDNSTELYEYYRDQYNEDIEYKIKKDLPRTCIGNQDFKIDHKSGKNQLFNVLNAYAAYDPEIGYCQGMNFIVALLIKYLEDEENSFFILCHIMKKHDWRGCFDMTTTKLKSLLEFLENVLEAAWPELYTHIMNEIEISLFPAFQSTIMTIFIYDCCENIAINIFDVFLLDGEQVIISLLLKMIEKKEQKIYTMEDHDCLQYLRSTMPRECLEEYELMFLMD